MSDLAKIVRKRLETLAQDFPAEWKDVLLCEAKAVEAVIRELAGDGVLSELDALYKRFREVERVAVWGGSYEREQGAQTELKPIVNQLFDGCLKFLELRADQPQKERTRGE